MTATGSERCTATPWRGSGRGFGTSSGRSGVSTKRTENSTSSFSSGLTTSRRSPTSSCGYCSDAREPPNWLHEPRQLSALDKVESHRIESLELYAGVGGGELPIHGAFRLVAVDLPGADL